MNLNLNLNLNNYLDKQVKVTFVNGDTLDGTIALDEGIVRRYKFQTASSIKYNRHRFIDSGHCDTCDTTEYDMIDVKVTEDEPIKLLAVHTSEPTLTRFIDPKIAGLSICDLISNTLDWGEDNWQFYTFEGGKGIGERVIFTQYRAGVIQEEVNKKFNVTKRWACVIKFVEVYSPTDEDAKEEALVRTGHKGEKRVVVRVVPEDVIKAYYPEVLSP